MIWLIRFTLGWPASVAPAMATGVWATSCIAILFARSALGAITGFSLDIEPSSNSSQEVDFINTMAQYQALLSGTGLTLSADAGTAWVAPPVWNVTVNGTSRVLSDWVVTLTNETIIMDYDRNATNLLVRAAPYLDYADALVQQGIPRNVTVGVAIASPGSQPTWWQTQSVDELESLITAVDPSLSTHPSFSRRYAIFTSDSLFNASSEAPCPTCSYAEQKTLWYLDDSWGAFSVV